MDISQIPLLISFILFIASILLLLALRTLVITKSHIIEYEKGKIPLRRSLYTPQFLSTISYSFVVSHNILSPYCYISSSRILIKVLFENTICKEDIKQISIYLHNGNDLDLKSRIIRIITYDRGIYTLFLKIDEINMKRTISKFKEYGYEKVLKY